MYYWKTRELADQIKEGDLGETEKKNYYIAASIIATLSLYATMGIGTTDVTATLIECALLILITIIGINVTFKSNLDDQGEDYIMRVVMLSLPIMIKITIISLLLGLFIGITIGLYGNETYYLSQWEKGFTAIMVQLIYFWRVNVHLKYINS